MWIFTGLLWRATKIAVADEKTALKIAQSNAEAARDSADALPTLERAYIFFEPSPWCAPNIKQILAGTASFGLGSDSPRIDYEFANHGKTPAILKRMSAIFAHLTELPARGHNISEPLGSEIVIPGGGIYPCHRSISGPAGPMEITHQLQNFLLHPLNDDEKQSIGAGMSFLWFYGNVIYDDVFGREHETRFCWRYNGMANTFQRYDRGDEELNRRT